MTTDELVEKIVEWEYENGESFHDYYTNSYIDDVDWADWLKSKGFAEMGNKIIEECKQNSFNGCTDLELKFEAYEEHNEDDSFNEENNRKNLQLVSEYILQSPSLSNKILDVFEGISEEEDDDDLEQTF